jgi:hypothetical protein
MDAQNSWRVNPHCTSSAHGYLHAQTHVCSQAGTQVGVRIPRGLAARVGNFPAHLLADRSHCQKNI